MMLEAESLRTISFVLVTSGIFLGWLISTFYIIKGTVKLSRFIVNLWVEEE